MAKRKFAALVFVGIGAIMLASGARAQQAFAGADGCAVLAQLVYTEVTTQAWYGPDRHRQAVYAPNESGVKICNYTTRTVHKAFTSALNAVGANFRRGYPSGGPGDACLSGFLQQCYPERYPIDGANRWRAVSRTVLQAMPRGTASDQSIFSAGAMRLALRAALAQENSQP